MTRFRLKQIITNNERRVYYSGTDIRPDDLENFLTGSVLIGGRNILDLAQRGSQSYKKALAFNMHKWDSVKMEPIASGNTINIKCKPNTNVIYCNNKIVFEKQTNTIINHVRNEFGANKFRCGRQ